MGKSRLTLNYGDRKTAVTVNERNLIQVIQPNEIEAGDEEGEIICAMQHPIERPTLNEIVSARKASKKDLTAVIIVSDVTRPTPTKKMLPYVLARPAQRRDSRRLGNDFVCSRNSQAVSRTRDENARRR